MMTNVSERLALFQELSGCVYNLYLWKYDAEMNLISSNCPEEEALNLLFSLQDIKEYIQEYIKSVRIPLLFSNSLDLTWITVFESEEEQVCFIHLLGPVFTDEISVRDKERELEQHALSVKSKSRFLRLLDSLPVIAVTQFLQYGIMLHCCVTGEKIRNSDFHYYRSQNSRRSEHMQSREMEENTETQHISYLFEQRLLEIVETGNTAYFDASSQLTFLGKVGKVSAGDTLRQAQNTCVIHTTLCTRAAIRGGLSPEIAYTLSDNYIQSCESCRLPTEVYSVIKEMFRDFVERVHAVRSRRSEYSFLIQKCCDYIDIYVEKGVTVKALADYTGYTQNYLGAKFKLETGTALKEYINGVRTERAKQFLALTTQSIAEVGEKLGYGSTSYFIKMFRENVGITPTEYRNKIQEGK